ncbi:MAG: alanine dehydrogenase [Balneolaceae bacterium]
MIIGIPKEIKTHENRVSLLPGGVRQFVRSGHEVLVEKGAGSGSSFSDEAYRESGATVLESAEEIWKRSELILKVKEPVPEEYSRIRPGQVIFTYFHFAASRELTQAVIDSGAVAIAYETVEKADGSLPLLIPMSEVAGRMAPQEGAKYLEKPFGGRGVLMGGIPGVSPANVMVLGGGIVGVHAARIAAGMGAETVILDISLPRLRHLDEVMPRNVRTLYSNETNIRNLLPQADLVIGAVLKPGAKAPHLITRNMLSDMKPGAVLVDVAIDQGGCFETSRPTTHNDPVYLVDGIVHYCVANMPGAVPHTSTLGLTNATLPYALELAGKGWKRALTENEELMKGLNISQGKVVYKYVAEAFGLEHTPVEKVIGNSSL